MEIETRTFGTKKILILKPTKAESFLIDEVLGDKPFDDDGKGPEVKGNVCLSDGYGEHYIRLERVTNT